jgi:hypothetical protein
VNVNVNTPAGEARAPTWRAHRAPQHAEEPFGTAPHGMRQIRTLRIRTLRRSSSGAAPSTRRCCCGAVLRGVAMQDSDLAEHTRDVSGLRRSAALRCTASSRISAMSTESKTTRAKRSESTHQRPGGVSRMHSRCTGTGCPPITGRAGAASRSRRPLAQPRLARGGAAEFDSVRPVRLGAVREHRPGVVRARCRGLSHVLWSRVVPRCGSDGSPARRPEGNARGAGAAAVVHPAGSATSAVSAGMSSLCALMNRIDTSRAPARKTAPQKKATW